MFGDPLLLRTHDLGAQVVNITSRSKDQTESRYAGRDRPMRPRLGPIYALLLALCSTSSLATSHFVDSQIRLSHIQRHTESMLNDAEIRIAEFLTRSERQIQRQATIKVPASYALIAHAYPGNIEISSGTFWVLEQLTMAHIAEHQLGYSGCEEDYTNYVASGITQHTRDAKSTFNQLPLTAYATEFGGTCTGFHPSKIIDQGVDNSFLRLLKASMTLIYLHELGHHVLGHVQHLPADMSRSREYEAAADAWAIDAAFRSGFNVLEGVPALNLIAALGAGSADAEATQTHPLGIRRVRHMMHQALEILAKQGKDEVVAWLTNQILEKDTRFIDDTD